MIKYSLNHLALAWITVHPTRGAAPWSKHKRVRLADYTRQASYLQVTHNIPTKSNWEASLKAALDLQSSCDMKKKNYIILVI